MSSTQEKLPIINPADVEDARQALAQLSPEEQAALGATTAYVLEFFRQGRTPGDIIAELSKDPQVARAYDHLAQIPEKPAG